MKARHIAAFTVLALLCSFFRAFSAGAAVSFYTAEENYNQDTPGNLYALSAVLMDGESGRVLYKKDGDTPRPMASTTKVMTCILALENSNGDDYVQVSETAASQPEVKLGMRVGEQYYMEDLLYSLMLKSHNDTAVAIAEQIGGSVSGFAEMMNEKAEELGCEDTYFITPNGLDAEDEGGVHHTTARDLALIMRYAIKNPLFLKITETRSHTFSDIKKTRQFSVENANALLDMTDGVLSGKTGFTGDAGYCYVCACKKGDKTLIVALLGCGWPNNKSYKWTDTLKLLSFGEENFKYYTFWKEPSLEKVLVKDGVEEESFGEEIYLKGEYKVSEEEKNRRILLGKSEAVTCKVTMEDTVEAPVEKGERIGEITYFLEGEPICSYPVYAEKSVEKLTYQWCVDKVFHDFFH